MKELFRHAVIPLLILLIASSTNAQAQPDIYVSLKGDDKNSGSMNAPLRSLEAAVKMAGDSKEKTAVTIAIRGGFYPINETIVLDSSMLNSKNIIIEPYQNEKVVISGGMQLDLAKFRKSTDERMTSVGNKQKGIYETTLQEQKITDYGTMKQHGFGRIEVASMEIFINKTPFTLARWPNSGFVDIGKILEPGSNTRPGDKRNVGAKFEYNLAEPSGWKTSNDIWLYGVFNNGYADDNIAVESINTNDKSIKLKQAGYYGVMSTTDSKNPAKIYPWRGYYFYNVAEELDSAGEWYLDKEKNKLFIYPSSDIASSIIVASMLETPLLFLHHAKNITFKNIEFGYGRGIGIYATGTENITFSNCEFYNFGVQALNIGDPVIGFKLHHNNKLISKDRTANTSFSLSGCKIYNTGAGALTIGGGDRKTLTPSSNKITDCEIFNYSRTNRASPAAIQVSGVGNSISHCYIHDGPSAAIGYKGNDHIISYNHIRNVGNEFSDIGAVYTGRDPSSTGTRITNNFFDSIQGKNKSAVAAVYIDDGSSGISVSDNIFYKCGSGTVGFGAIHVNGGYENLFEHNFFVDCDKAFSNTVWDDNKWIEYMQKPDMQKKLRQDVDIYSATYTSRYSFLKTFLDPKEIGQRKNYVSNSYVYSVSQFVPKKNRFEITNTYSSQDGSELVSINGKNFSIKMSKQKQTGLKQIAFGEIGLRNNKNESK